jgi:hypothetical protein
MIPELGYKESSSRINGNCNWIVELIQRSARPCVTRDHHTARGPWVPANHAIIIAIRNEEGSCLRVDCDACGRVEPVKLRSGAGSTRDNRRRSVGFDPHHPVRISFGDIDPPFTVARNSNGTT